MGFSHLFRFRKNSPALTAAMLISGVALAVGGSVFATSVGSNVTVSSVLTVNGRAQFDGNVGLGTSTPGTLLSVQGTGSWANAATSTLYTALTLSRLTSTSTVLFATSDGSVGFGTTTPGTFFGIQGIASFVQDATSTVYSRLLFPSFSATSTSATSTVSTGGFNVGAGQFVVQQNSGSVGIGTSTPGSLLSLQGVANFVQDATSTVYSRFASPSFSATSTIATTTVSTGGFQVGSQGSAAFTVLQSATTSVGVGTSTPTSHQFAVSGNALIGSGSTGTSTITLSSSGANIGSCIELKATDGTFLRIYATSSPSAAQAYTNAQGARGFEKLVVEAGSCR